MASMNSSHSVSGRLARSEIERRARAACSRISSLDVGKFVDAGPLLKILSEGGLLQLGFLNGDATEIGPDDIEQACWTLEFLAGGSAGAASAYMVNTVLGAAVIAMMGTPEQRKDLLRRASSGDLQLAFGVTEPNAGSDAGSMATTCSRVDDGFALNGDKIYTTGAASADFLLVVARNAGGDANDRSFSILLVPGKAQGLTVKPLRNLAGHVHASCEVALRDVRVPASSVLGGSKGCGKAWATLRKTGSLERLVVSFLARGLARSIVGRAVEFAKQRQQFGKPISSFQAIQHTLVEMTIIEHAMQLFCEGALSSLKSGADTTREIPMAKYFCSEQLQRLISRGIRVMGGRAYFDFEDMARYYLEAPFSLYAGGTVEIQKMLIARTMGI